MFRRFIKTEKHARLRGGDLRATTLLFICVRVCARAYFSRKSESSGETNEEVDALKKRVVIIIRGRGGKKGKGKGKFRFDPRASIGGGSARTGRCTDIRRDGTVIYIIIREPRE